MLHYVYAMKKVIRIALGSFGVFLLLMSLPFVGMTLWDFFSPTENPETSRGILIALVLLFGGIGYVGWMLIKNNFWLSRHKLEQRILELAQAHHGTLTVYDVALLPEVSPRAAKNALDALVHEGLATSYVNAEGTILYLFGNTPLLIEDGEPSP